MKSKKNKFKYKKISTKYIYINIYQIKKNIFAFPSYNPTFTSFK